MGGFTIFPGPKKKGVASEKSGSNFKKKKSGSNFKKSAILWVVHLKKVGRILKKWKKVGRIEPFEWEAIKNRYLNTISPFF